MMMYRGAIFSEDGRHRPLLIRHWDMDLPVFSAFMLNPSKANSERDDPTTTFMINIAKREGCGRYYAANLHDYVDTDPKGMKNIIDPVSPDNNRYISLAASEADIIVVAWGRDGNFMGRVDQVIKIIKEVSKPIYCFGRNNDGSPRFPRALSKNVNLQLYME